MGDITRAWVLHTAIYGSETARLPENAAEEAFSLANALSGLEVAGVTIVKLQRAHPNHLFGKGKVAELKEFFHDSEIELVLVDGAVTPVQQRNLEKLWGVKILDRTSLILEIFSERARTREGVIQVEMAALAYQRTRLVRAWTHLERQRGGLGFVGGPGETQIESDRRAIDEQLNRLKRQISKVIKTRNLHRSARAKVPYPIVSLVGYTNAGKSTLFNSLTGSDVMEKDMLFATLDPTMRMVELRNNQQVILSDTVGFISDLPTELVASFRATLEEVTAADVIVHVRDIAHPDMQIQYEDVNKIMDSLGVSPDVPKIEVWNKYDRLDAETGERAIAQAESRVNTIVMSALTGHGTDDFLDCLAQILRVNTVVKTMPLGFDDGRQRAWLYKQKLVRLETQTENGFELEIEWSQQQAAQYHKLFG